MRYVEINKGIPGMILAKSIYDENGRVLLGYQSVLTEEFIDKLKERGFPGIYIEDELSKDIEVQETITTELRNKGAKSVRAVATHAVLSGSAYENIAKSALTELIVSDTIPLRCSPETDTSKIKVLSVANLFGDIIDKVYNYQSISNSFIF